MNYFFDRIIEQFEQFLELSQVYLLCLKDRCHITTKYTDSSIPKFCEWHPYFEEVSLGGGRGPWPLRRESPFPRRTHVRTYFLILLPRMGDCSLRTKVSNYTKLKTPHFAFTTLSATRHLCRGYGLLPPSRNFPLLRWTNPGATPVTLT